MITPEEIKHNLSLPPIEVKHKKLNRIGNSQFRSVCPCCNEGVLLFKRDYETLNLKKEDNCISCGRRFLYTDIEETVILTYKK
jgi:uncharacterized protein (DUF983 family)